jgi:hypothetical protein
LRVVGAGEETSRELRVGIAGCFTSSLAKRPLAGPRRVAAGSPADVVLARR